MEKGFEFINKVSDILCESNKMDKAEIEAGISELASYVRGSQKLWQLHWFIMQIASETELQTVAQLTLNTFYSLINPSSCALFLLDETSNELKEYNNFGKLVCEEGSVCTKKSLLSEKVGYSVNVQDTCDCKYDYIKHFPLTNRNGDLLGYLVGYFIGAEYDLSEDIKMFMDIFTVQIGLSIEAVLLKDKMAVLAYTDELTALSNKRVLLSRLEESMLRYVQAKVQKTEHKGVGVILFDVDSFKHYNDAFGHLAGDVVLKTLGEIINGITEEGQLGARYGGEELCVCLDNATERETYELAERIRKAIEDTQFEYRVVTVSGGVAHYPTVNFNNKTELLRGADTALYNSKNTGKNRISIYRA